MRYTALLIILSLFSWALGLSSVQGQRNTDSLLRVSERLTDLDTAKAGNYYRLATAYYRFAPDSAVIFAQKAIDIAQNLSYKEGLADGYKAKATGHFIRGDYENAMTSYLKALEIYEPLQDVRNIGAVNNNLGNIFWSIGDYKRAKSHYHKARISFEALDDRARTSAAYLNLGAAYDQLGIIDSTLFFNQLSLELKEELEDWNGVAGIKNNLGYIMLREGDCKQAVQYLHEAVDLYLQVDNKLNIPTAYGNLAECFMQLGEMTKAYSFIQKGLEAARELGSLKHERDMVELQYLYYDAVGEHANAFASLLGFMTLKDSIFNAEINEQILDMQTRYETEKTQQEIQLLQTSQEKDRLTIQRQRLQFLVLVILLASVLAFAVQLSRTSAQRKKANRLLQLKNDEITEQREEILFQNEILKQQKEEIQTIVENLKDANYEITIKKQELEQSHQQITDSITYARRIQNAILPRHEILSPYFADNFILFLPCDIVSGDFYYIKQIDNILLMAAADCTGHGVPGAFMSMLGTASLNEIVRRKEVESAAEVLNQLRDFIKTSLQQGDQSDGLDIAFGALDLTTLELKYAGAYNPLWIFRKGALMEIAADKMPVGSYINERPFSQQIIRLEKNDVLYMFSDGYFSQFRDNTQEKFGSAQLKELLTQIHLLPMSEQHRILENTFNQWKGNEDQLDDVLIMGMKV